MPRKQPAAKKAAKAKPFDPRHMTRQELREHNAQTIRKRVPAVENENNDRPENSAGENPGSTE